ncbi:MAG TPA: PAS domain S-box protein [Candidatus Limnocylindrales bacterium]|nr:PAS domain S-box protein [Candidatus Limnocylindrales bacterium]
MSQAPRRLPDPPPVAICLLDSTGAVRMWSPGARQIFGWTEAEVLGHPDPIADPESELTLRALRARSRAGEAVSGIEVRCRRKDGSPVDVSVSTAPVHDAAGRVSGVVEVIADVTARRRAEDALRSSEARYRWLFEDNPLPMWVSDLETRAFLDVNEAAIRQYGHPRDEFLRMTIDDLRPPEDVPRVPGALAEPEAETVGVWRHRRKDGRLIDVEVVRHALVLDGRPALLALAHDVTERRRAEEALWQAKGELERRVAERTAALTQANARLEAEVAERRRAEAQAADASQAKSEVLARMSHELRTPLNAILGFAQRLERAALAPEDRESVGHIRKTGQQLLGLINEVLDLSHIETRRLALSPEPVAVRDVVEGALALIRPLAERRRIQLEVALDEGAGWHVLADRERLHQVLLNVLSNAVSYNREGGTVAVSCTRVPGSRVRVTVSDTGPGIPPERLARLFTPFDRLGASPAPTEGAGLGLVLARGLLEAMGGRLTVESTVGQGTTCTIALPETENPTAVQERSGAAAVVPGTSGTVLYIEDNLANLRVLERIVSRRPGVKLVTAMQGRLGLDLARQHRPAFILLDLNLPDISGQDALAALRAEPETRDIPVAILSADAGSLQVKQLLEQGAIAYLTMPLDVARLLGLLDEVLGSV